LQRQITFKESSVSDSQLASARRRIANCFGRLRRAQPNTIESMTDYASLFGTGLMHREWIAKKY
jgi:hypothetical protein